MMYKVTKQYGLNRELDSGQFKDLNAAHLHVQEKMRDDVILKVKAIYRIYEWDDLIEELSTDDISYEDESGSSDAGKKSNFNPTPLNSTPRPAGMPHNWVKDEDDGDKDKK